jgi:hypothetical protein
LVDLGAAEAESANGARGLRIIKEMIKQATRVRVHEWWSASLVLII